MTPLLLFAGLIDPIADETAASAAAVGAGPLLLSSRFTGSIALGHFFVRSFPLGTSTDANSTVAFSPASSSAVAAFDEGERRLLAEAVAGAAFSECEPLIHGEKEAHAGPPRATEHATREPSSARQLVSSVCSKRTATTPFTLVDSSVSHALTKASSTAELRGWTQAQHRATCGAADRIAASAVTSDADDMGKESERTALFVFPASAPASAVSNQVEADLDTSRTVDSGSLRAIDSTSS